MCARLPARRPPPECGEAAIWSHRSSAPISWWSSLQEFFSNPEGPFYLGSLKPAAAPPKQKEKNHDEQDQAETTAAIIADSGPHVVAAPARQQQDNDENNDQRHVQNSSMPDRLSTDNLFHFHSPERSSHRASNRRSQQRRQQRRFFVRRYLTAFAGDALDNSPPPRTCLTRLAWQRQNSALGKMRITCNDHFHQTVRFNEALRSCLLNKSSGSRTTKLPRGSWG